MAEMFGGKPKVRQPEPLKPSPKASDKEVQDATAEALRRRRKQRGVHSTILNKMLEEATGAPLQEKLSP